MMPHTILSYPYSQLISKILHTPKIRKMRNLPLPRKLRRILLSPSADVFGKLAHAPPSLDVLARRLPTLEPLEEPPDLEVPAIPPALGVLASLPSLLPALNAAELPTLDLWRVSLRLLKFS